MKIAAVVLVAALAGSASAAVINTNASANNGGSANWAIFLDLSAGASPLNVTNMTTASAAAANGSFTVEVLTRAGSALGGPVAAGPGSSMAGWTSLGIANATQGAVGSGISLDIDIPDIFVAAGSTVGVAFRFGVSGPRYFGTGTAPIQQFTDGALTIDTGNARSAPFTTGGSFFSSRAHVGSFTYEVVPAPASMALLGLGGLVAGRRRR